MASIQGQYVEQAIITTTPAIQNATIMVPPLSLSHSVSSTYTNAFLNLENLHSTKIEVVSMLDINVHHEVPRTSPLLTIYISVIPEHIVFHPSKTVTTAPATTITSLLSSLFPSLQQQIPIPTPTNTEATTSTIAVPKSETLSAIHQRITDLEKDVKELKSVDNSTTVISTNKFEVPNAVKKTEIVKRLKQQYAPQKSIEDIRKIKMEHARKQQVPKETTTSSDTAALEEFDQKTTLFNTMTKSKSFSKRPKHRALYHALMESILEDEDAMDKVIIEYLVNISKRRAFWSLNEDILKINDSDYQYAISIKEDTAYPCLHSPKTTKETSSIRRIQRRPIRRIEDIVCEDSGRYQTWSLLQETPIRLRMTKVIKEEFEKLEDLKIKDVSLTYDTSLEVFNNDFNRLSGMDDDLFTYEVEVANIPYDSNMDDDSEHDTDDDMGYDPSDVAFNEWLGSKIFNYKTMDHYTIKALWIYWIRGNDEVELTDEESSDNEDDIAEVFRIDINIFNYETPLCLAFNEFNYLSKVYSDLLTKDIMGFKTYEHYKDDWIYEWNENVPWVYDKPWLDNGIWKEPTPMEDSELKEEALRNRTIMEGLIEEDDDDESHYEQKRRWNVYTNYDDAYEINYDVAEREELCEIHELPVCNIRRFEMIKFGQNKKYVAIKENKYDDLARTSKDVCRAYQEIFLIMEYLVKDSKRRAFWSLNEDILKITILKTNTPYPSRIDTSYPCHALTQDTKDNSSITPYLDDGPLRLVLKKFVVREYCKTIKCYITAGISHFMKDLNVWTSKGTETSKKTSTSKDSSKGKTPSTSSKSSINGKSAKDQVVKPISVQDSNNAEHGDAEFKNTGMPMDQGEDLGKTDEQPKYEVVPNIDWYKKSISDTSPDPEWNEGKLVDDGSEQSWLNDLAKATKPPLTFDELMHTPINFSTFAMNRLKIDNLTKEHLVGPVYNLLKGT
ncbi:hypothetical protein Tco_1016700 [Tanacetum coccineum]|uniref:Uncharacterized protein n=1 Tax=Tanacetum coccineum TaxID=301880 RepID=A0ABQ5FQK6_9ASTR